SARARACQQQSGVNRASGAGLVGRTQTQALCPCCEDSVPEAFGAISLDRFREVTLRLVLDGDQVPACTFLGPACAAIVVLMAIDVIRAFDRATSSLQRSRKGAWYRTTWHSRSRRSTPFRIPSSLRQCAGW